MELDRFLFIARRWWLALVLAALSGALAAYFVAGLAPDQYEARTRLLVGPLTGTLDVLRASSSIATTYRDLATSTAVLNNTAERLNISGGAAAIRADVSSTADTDTRLIDIAVDYTDPKVAADIANTIASELVRLEAATQPTSPEGTITVVDSAEPPLRPTSQAAVLPMLFGAAAGFLGVGLLIVLYELRADRVRGQHDAVETSALEGLGSVTALRGASRDQSAPTLVRALPDSASAATYRTLAARAVLASGQDTKPSILVIAPDAGSRASEVAANLAAAYAGLGQRSFLLDANGLDSEIVVSGARDHELSLERLAAGSSKPFGLEIEPNLWAGTLTSADMVSISKESALRVLERISAQAEVVVINAGPVLLSASALSWAAAAGVTVLVAQRDRTTRTNVARGTDMLERVGANVLGIVLVAGTSRLPAQKGRARAGAKSRLDDSARRASL